MAEMWTHLAIERAGVVTLRLKRASRARSDQHRRLATRRAAAKANGLDAEIPSPGEADLAGVLGTLRAYSVHSMASADAEELGYARIGSPGVSEGGNSGESSGESPEGLMPRQEEPGMPKTDPITGPAGK